MTFGLLHNNYCFPNWLSLHLASQSLQVLRLWQTTNPGLKTPTGKSQPVGYLQACLRIWIPSDRGTNPASGGIGKTPTQDLLAILPSQYDNSITEPQPQ